MRLARVILLLASASYPILHLFVPNKGFIFEGGLLLPTLLISGLSLLFYSCTYLFTKKVNNSTLITALIILSLQIYGHVYYGLMDSLEIEYSNFRHRFFFPLFCSFFGLPIYFLFKKNDVSSKLIKLFAFIFTILCLQYAPALFTHYFKGNQIEKIQVKNEPLELNTPNIYYLILDSYSNDHNLKTYYNFDNSLFTDNLKTKGFQVIENANSNYPYTYFSLSSSLNMRYVNDFEDSVKLDKYNDSYPFTQIHSNKVVDYLREKGYRYVLSKSAYGQLNEPGNADVYIDNKTFINQFHQALMSLSLLSAFNIGKIYHNKVHETTLKAYENWNNIIKIKGSKFVFFHCLAPHPPLVFKADGSFNNISQKVSNRYQLKEAYIEQLKFINKAITTTVNKILELEENNAIIIIQGDHGTCSSTQFEDELKWPIILPDSFAIERYGILNAIHLPSKYSLKFKNSHTPVNSFTEIFNTVFNDSLKTVENRHFFGRYRPPYNIKEIKVPQSKVY